MQRIWMSERAKDSVYVILSRWGMLIVAKKGVSEVSSFNDDTFDIFFKLLHA